MADDKNPPDRDERARADVHMVAYHEAGHVVAAWRHGFKIKSATIVPEKDILGKVVNAGSPFAGVNIEYDNSPRARALAEDYIIGLLAGHAAERRYNPRLAKRQVVQSHGDHKQALDIADYMCSSAKAVDAYLNWLSVAADDLIHGAWDFVETIAKALIERRTLNAAEIAALLQERLSQGGEWRS